MNIAALGPAPEGIEATGSPAMNLPWTHAGLPTISLPAGYAVNGLPLGLQVAARFMADEQLIGWAVELEKELKSLNSRSASNNPEDLHIKGKGK